MRRRVDLVAVDERPVDRAEILDNHLAVLRREPDVAARHEVVLEQGNVGVCVPADLDRVRERERAAGFGAFDDLERERRRIHVLLRGAGLQISCPLQVP